MPEQIVSGDYQHYMQEKFWDGISDDGNFCTVSISFDFWPLQLVFVIKLIELHYLHDIDAACFC